MLQSTGSFSHAPFRALRVLLLCVLFCALLSSAAADTVFRASGEDDANRKALDLFCHCAFNPEYDGSAVNRLCRWKDEITLWVGGSPTPEDLRTVDAFLAELTEKVSGLPPIRRVSRRDAAAIHVWYVPMSMLGSYLENYVEDNWGFFTFNHTKCRITKARIGISTDITDQEERNHLFLEELTGALGLPGDHEVYTDSILYQPWTVVQSLSEVDWRMLNLLYSPQVSIGMTEEQARGALQAALGL